MKTPDTCQPAPGSTTDSEHPQMTDIFSHAEHERPQSRGEEIANSISHGIGMLLAIAATPILIVAAVRHSGAAAITGSSIFGASMILLYCASTLYHALPEGRGKRVFKVLDHSAIFLLIAGTYTPFTLGVLNGALGWTLFGLVWGLAIIGIIIKGVWGAAQNWISTALYVLMGWLIVIAIKPLWLNMPAWGLFWLVAGGLSYTLGVVFFVLDEKIKYSHFIWHLFVILGSVAHFFAVLWYSY